ncbi:copper amine oxidase [Melampsora americana]|nr:copper amine oxidase [Melampsora americana]
MKKSGCENKVENDIYHPLDPLTVEEIELATSFAIRVLNQDFNQPSVIIITATLLEPPKADVLKYLDSSTDQARIRPDRLCEVGAISRPSGKSYILKIKFPSQDPSLPILHSPIQILPSNVHLLISPEEIDESEALIKSNKLIHQLCEEVGVSPDQIACDGWAIGFDPELSFASPGRFQQCLMYARPEPHSNIYAHPLDFVPVLDTLTKKLIRIDFPSSRKTLKPDSKNLSDSKEKKKIFELTSGTTLPIKFNLKETLEKDEIDERCDLEKSLKFSGRERIKPPWTRYEYLPELSCKNPNHFTLGLDCNGKINGNEEREKIENSNGNRNGNGSLLEDHQLHSARPPLRPLHVIQPEGPSFELKGNQLYWQNWKIHVGFNHREGLVLNTISYKDHGGESKNHLNPSFLLIINNHQIFYILLRFLVYRPIFYRMSLVEMVVPYGAPEAPHHSKFAFDVGEYGLGNLTNSLSLGCDCLGEIRYLDAINVAHSGKAIVIKNAICIHEEDAGLLWKHTEVRPGGRSHSIRSRKLVISFICTIANYEYMFYWNFFQDGSINLETKLSGILNLHLLGPDDPTGPHGVQVAPQIIAQYHTHTFSLRIDPMIDGLNNSVLKTDIIPLPNPTGSIENYLGNGFITEKTVLKTTDEGAQDYDHDRDRTWTIINPNKLHYSTKEPIGYKISCKDQPKMLVNMNSMVSKRAPFAKHDLFVTPYVDNQFYPAGKFVTGTTSAPEDSIDNWLKGSKKIDNQDIVVYLTYGVNHLPTPEQFPIMPVEVLTVSLKPSGFFNFNPTLDILPIKDHMSRSCSNQNHAKTNEGMKRNGNEKINGETEVNGQVA